MMHDWGFGYGFMFGPIGMLAVAIVLVIPFWRICGRAGFPGIVSLLILIPLVNLLFLYWLAFAEWPQERAARLGRE